MTPRPPYEGTLGGLVLAIDFGTTFSGVSYAILDPGEVPKVRNVNNYPGQEDQAGGTKVPSVLYYDPQGYDDPIIGAQIGEADEDQKKTWIRVEWLKLLFRPDGQKLQSAPTPRLPPGKSSVQVLGDYLRYLKETARDHIADTEPGGDTMWDNVEDEIVFVLSHPNGWDGSQQSKLRDAAISGELIPATDAGRARIRFVSEGEASFHWCIDNRLPTNKLGVGSNFIVADLGGGTIDVSSFRVTAEKPLRIEETNPAACRLAGSIFVTHAFRAFAEQKLKSSRYGTPEIIDHLTHTFDQKAKRLFRNPSSSTTIQLRDASADDLRVGIQRGKFIVSGSDIKAMFEPSCRAVVETISAQTSQYALTTVFLVGGFAASRWLCDEVQRRLKETFTNVTVTRAESHGAKAVAEGAVGYFLDHYVSARVAKFTYGTYGNPSYRSSNPMHQTRETYVNPSSGIKYVRGAFFPLIQKGAVVSEKTVQRKEFSPSQSSPSEYSAFLQLICYQGSKPDIGWQDEDPGNFRELYSARATIPATSFEYKYQDGRGFWELTYSFVVTFGTTEFSCHVEWSENGQTKRSPANVVWNEG